MKDEYPTFKAELDFYALSDQMKELFKDIVGKAEPMTMKIRITPGEFIQYFTGYHPGQLSHMELRNCTGKLLEVNGKKVSI